jgi:hypothetical protein
VRLVLARRGGTTADADEQPASPARPPGRPRSAPQQEPPPPPSRLWAAGFAGCAPCTGRGRAERELQNAQWEGPRTHRTSRQPTPPEPSARVELGPEGCPHPLRGALRPTRGLGSMRELDTEKAESLPPGGCWGPRCQTRGGLTPPSHERPNQARRTWGGVVDPPNSCHPPDGQPAGKGPRSPPEALLNHKGFDHVQAALSARSCNEDLFQRMR